MKNKIYYLTLLSISLFMFSCNKSDIDYIFGEQPEERIAKKLDELKTVLLSSPHGWKASLNTTVRGGYGFYVNFNADETLEMLSDFNTNASETLIASTYRVKWGMDASLLFDTYNYITMLQDPNPSINGGTGGQGLQSDVEFEYVRITQDSVILKGTRYKNLLILTKLTQVDQEAYLAGRYKTDIAKVDDYFSVNSNNYINIEGVENKIEVVINPTSKLFIFQYADANNNLQSASYKFNYELDGINFNVPLVISNTSFKRGVLKEGNFYLYDTSGKEYIVQQHNNIILPIAVLFGYNKVYNKLQITTSLPNGIESEFNSIYADVVTRFGQLNPARDVIEVMFRLTNSTKAEVGVQSRVPGGSTYAMGYASYDYTINENGLITLSNPVYDSNYAARISQLGPIRDFFLNSEWQLITVTSTDPGVKNIGGLQKVGSPNTFFYGTLTK